MHIGRIALLFCSAALALAGEAGWRPLLNGTDLSGWETYLAKPPKTAVLPGGLGLSFDWTLMRHHAAAKPWFLAGGLSSETVAAAVKESGASMLDISSGVESAPGVKDSALISGFLRAAKSL